MASKSQQLCWSRLLLHHRTLKTTIKHPQHFCRKIYTVPHFPTSQTPHFSFLTKAHYSAASDRVVKDLLAEVEKDRQREREQRIRAGLDTKDIDAEADEDYLGVTPLIEKIQAQRDSGDPNARQEPDYDSDQDDERFKPEAMKKRRDQFRRKFKRHRELLDNFTDAETLDDAFKWMNKIDKFEQKHFQLWLEYRVIGELMNRLKVAEGKDKFILQQKLNRAMRLVEWKEAFDPKNPANFGVIQYGRAGASADLMEHGGSKQMLRGEDDDDEEEFDDMKERDDILLEKLDAIDKNLEQKLAELDHTFGKKGKILEEEIRVLAEERNELTEKKRRPLYRIGFDMKVLNVNRTCKVTKGGQVAKFAAIVACGNYHGAIGFAKAKGPTVPVAIQKAREKCYQNIHYWERHEDHTIAQAIQASYKKTKVYLWPAPTRTGVKGGKKIVQPILSLAGFKNIKSKVIGSRNPFNTIKALMKAMNLIETPKDVQEKFGRTVVEKYLL